MGRKETNQTNISTCTSLQQVENLSALHLILELCDKTVFKVTEIFLLSTKYLTEISLSDTLKYYSCDNIQVF